MAAVLTSWEGHSPHPRLPVSMADKFIKAGFRFSGAAVFPILNLQYDEDSYSWGLAQLVRNFVARKNDVSADDLKDWHSELERSSEAGRYFFQQQPIHLQGIKTALYRLMKCRLPAGTKRICARVRSGTDHPGGADPRSR